MKPQRIEFKARGQRLHRVQALFKLDFQFVRAYPEDGEVVFVFDPPSEDVPEPFRQRNFNKIAEHPSSHIQQRIRMGKEMRYGTD